MRALTTRGFLLAVFFGGLAGNPAWSGEALTGTYTVQGGKGAVTLVLQQDADGKVTGSLKEGELSLVLKGIPQSGGGVVGTAITERGEFASYFQAARPGRPTVARPHQPG